MVDASVLWIGTSALVITFGRTFVNGTTPDWFAAISPHLRTQAFAQIALRDPPKFYVP